MGNFKANLLIEDNKILKLFDLFLCFATEFAVKNNDIEINLLFS